MSISNLVNRATLEGNGVTTVLPLNFPFHTTSDLVVVQTVIATGAESTLVLDSDYTVSGAQNDAGQFPTGGTITFAVAPPSTVRLVAYRDPAMLQGVVLQETGKIPVKAAIESPLDKLTMVDQRLSERIDRALRLSDGDSTPLGRLPAKTVRASRYLGFDGDGNPTMMQTPTGVVTSLAQLTESSKAALPAAGAAGSLRKVTDDARGIWMDTGVQWHQVTGGVYNVRDFGAKGDGSTDDAAAFQASQDAVPATGGVIIVPDSALGYLINTQIDVDKPTVWLIGNATITGPATGYLFDVQVNDCGIEGRTGTVLKATSGCSGVIRNNQTLRCHYWNFKISSNDVQNAHLFHHYGGWYIDVKNVEIAKSTTHSTTNAIYIQSVTTGVAGSTGSFGGAYVGVYENVVALRVKILGDLTGSGNRVTTMTFTNLDASYIIAGVALGITFVQPVIQQSATGTMFDLDNVSGLTCIGGDFEGVSSTIYKCVNSCRAIHSINNQISGSGLVYFNGVPTASSYFMDDDTVSVSGIVHGYIGSTQPFDYVNQGWDVRHHLGVHYSGDTFEIGANAKRISSTEANLADVTLACTIASCNSSGEFTVRYAGAGANPRTLTQLMKVDNQGITTLGGAKWSSGTGSPEAAVNGNVGDLYTRLDGSTSTTLYVKTSGTGNTGWTAK